MSHDRSETPDDFAYLVSHDLKEPLVGIRLRTQSIRDALENGDGDAALEALEGVETRVQAMARMVDSFFEYARGAESGDGRAVPLDELLDDAMASLGVPAGFRVEWEEDLPMVQGALMQLEHVLHNLVSNAIAHHHRRNGRVTIRGHGETIEVEDDGPGIPVERRERIFDEFHSTRGVGHGVGLTMVRRLIEGRGGSIGVHDGSRGGTLVRFTWPAGPDDDGWSPPGEDGLAAGDVPAIARMA